MTRCSWTRTVCEPNQDGSVLVAVMAIMAALVIIFLVSLTIAVAGYSRHVKSNNRLAAKFLAESGIQRASLESAQIPQSDSVRLPVAPNGGSYAVHVVPWGPYKLAFSGGRFANQVVHTPALLGSPLPATLRAAITVSDPDYPLIVSGTTTIIGDVISGPLGISTGRFQGEDVVNERYHTGNAFAVPHPPVFQVDSTILKQYIVERDGRRLKYGSRLPASVSFAKGDFSRWGNYRSVSVENNAFINGLDFSAHDAIYSLFADGYIEIKGNSTIRGTLEIVSSSYILVGDSSVVDQAILTATDSIVICGIAHFGGIAVCPGRIIVRDRAVLQYPATLLVTSKEQSEADNTEIVVTDRASGEATLIALSDSAGATHRKPTIMVDSSVMLTGVFLSQSVVNVRGKLFGAVWTPVFSFYSAPTTYVNWLRNCQIDRTKLNFVPSIPILPRDTAVSANRAIWQESGS